MKKKLSTEWGNGIRLSYTAALKISTIAFMGAAALQLLNTFGYASELEQPARRVMWMSLLVGGATVLAGAIAGSLCADQESSLYTQIIEQDQKLKRIERENQSLKEQIKHIDTKLEAEPKERSNREDRLKDKQDKIEALEYKNARLIEVLAFKNQSLEEWEEWEELVKQLWGIEYCVTSCRGCKHLDGSSHENKYFICAIHPYGQRDCEDWESREK